MVTMRILALVTASLPHPIALAILNAAAPKLIEQEELMNTNTGEIRTFDALTEKDRESGEWVPVSSALAAAARELNLAAATREHDRRQRQLDGLRKPGRR